MKYVLKSSLEHQDMALSADAGLGEEWFLMRVCFGFLLRSKHQRSDRGDARDSINSGLLWRVFGSCRFPY